MRFIYNKYINIKDVFLIDEGRWLRSLEICKEDVLAVGGWWWRGKSGKSVLLGYRKDILRVWGRKVIVGWEGIGEVLGMKLKRFILRIEKELREVFNLVIRWGREEKRCERFLGFKFRRFWCLDLEGVR